MVVRPALNRKIYLKVSDSVFVIDQFFIDEFCNCYGSYSKAYFLKNSIFLTPQRPPFVRSHWGGLRMLLITYLSIVKHLGFKTHVMFFVHSVRRYL